MGAETQSATKGGQFGRSVLVSVFFVGLMSLLALGNSVLLARIGGPEARGIYGLAVAVLAIAGPACSLGLGQSSTFMIARGAGRSPVATLNLVVLGVLAPVSLGLGGIALFGAVVVIDQPLELAVVAAIAGLPMLVYLEAARGVYLGARQIWAYNTAQAATVATLLVLNATLLVRGQNWALINLVGSYWVVGVIVAAAMTLQSGFRWPTRDLVVESVRYGVKAAGTTLADASLLRVDYLVMAPFVSLAAIGRYAISDQLTHLMAWVGLAAGKMMLAESSSDASGEASLQKLGLAMRLYELFLLVLAVGGVATLWFLIPLVFGDDFAPSYVGVLLLLPAAFFKSLHALVSTYLAGRGVQKPVLVAGATAVGFDAVAVLVVAPIWGWLAVAGVRSIAYGIQFGLTYRALGRYVEAEGLARPRLRCSLEDVRVLRGWIAKRL